MKGGVGPIVGSRRDTRWLGVFLVADIAFVCVLLVATVLVVTSFRLITTADLGFERQNVMFLWYQQSLKEVARADRPSAIAALRSNLIERGKSVPGVTDVAIMTTAPPLSGTRYRVSVVIPGLGETVGDMRPEMRVVSPDYFRVMAMRLISGRQFHFSDRSGAPQVMIINDIAARRYFPDRDAIGQVVAFRGPTTIIGVVKGSHNDGPESEVRPEVYTPLDQEPYHDFDVTELGGAITAGGLVLRTSRDARALAPSVLNTIRPGVTRLPNPPEFVDDYFRRLTAVRRFNAQLMGVFGLLAVAIGAIGVYGTMAFVVAREVPAIGLRMALGASPAVVMSSALREALQRVAVGIALGWVGAWFGSNALESFVFGIRPTDLTVYGAVGGFLAVIGVAAGFIPALRAARVNPLAALRCE
jgi:predicted permease